MNSNDPVVAAAISVIATARLKNAEVNSRSVTDAAHLVGDFLMALDTRYPQKQSPASPIDSLTEHELIMQYGRHLMPDQRGGVPSDVEQYAAKCAGSINAFADRLSQLRKEQQDKPC